MSALFDQVLSQVQEQQRTKNAQYSKDAREKLANCHFLPWSGKTYGEIWVEFINHKDYFKGDDFDKKPPLCPKRMPRQKAMPYYKTKLRNVWDELYPVKPNDFLKLDDYFDYYQAKRVVNNLILGDKNETLRTRQE